MDIALENLVRGAHYGYRLTYCQYGICLIVAECALCLPY